MMKELIGLGFILTFITCSSVNAKLIKQWPGYIDNSQCQKGAVECGRSFFNEWNSDGTMYRTEKNKNDDGLVQKINEQWNRQGPGYNTQKVDVKIAFSWTGIPTQIGGNDQGITLNDGHGNPTTYRLKGFGYNDLGMGIQLHLCKLDKSLRTCKEDYGKPLNFSFPFSSMLTGKYESAFTLEKDGDNWIGVSWMQIWTSTNDIRLGVDNDGNQMAVRSLRFPGLLVNATFTTYPDPNTNYKVDTSNYNYYPFSSKVVRLNDRKCSLNITGTPVMFSTPDSPLSVTTAQSGNIGPVKPTTLQLSCEGGVNDASVVDISGVDKLTPINGENAIHTVTSIKIVENDPVYINGQPQIKMSHSTEGAASNLYVLGSLSNEANCQVDPLRLSENLVDKFNLQRFPNNNVVAKPDFSIPQFDLGTIHWRLCKESGTLNDGKYSGSANIIVEYK